MKKVFSFCCEEQKNCLQGVYVCYANKDKKAAIVLHIEGKAVSVILLGLKM